MIFLNGKSSLLKQRSTNSNGTRLSRKSVTKEDTIELTARVFAIITVIIVLFGIGLLIYGAVAKYISLLISGAVIILFGIVFLGLTIILYLKSHPTSTFYIGKTAATNRVEQINIVEMNTCATIPDDNVLYAIDKLASFSNNHHENRPEPDASAVHTV